MWPNGNFYRGEWKNDRASGVGLLLKKDERSTYSGMFVSGLPEGKGTKLCADG